MGEKIKQYLRKPQTKIAVFACLILWLAANAYGLLSPGFSHDGLVGTFGAGDYNNAGTLPTISLGRFLILPFILFRGELVSPWFAGMWALIWQISTVLLLVSIFQVKKPIAIVGLSIIVVLNISSTLLYATYPYCSDVYALAVFLATFAFFFAKGSFKSSGLKRLFFLLGAFLCLLGSLSIYQCEISVFLVLFLLWAIQYSISKKEPKSVLLYALTSLILSLLACLAWLGLAYFFSYVTQQPLSSDYNGITTIGDFSNGSIFSLAKESYLTPLKSLGLIYPFVQESILHPHFAGLLCLVSMFLFTFFCLAKSLKNGIPSFLIVGFALFLLPLAAGISLFVSKGVFHELMHTAIFFILIGPCLILNQETRSKKVFLHICIVICGISFAWQAFGSVAYANQLYLIKDSEADAGIAAASRLLSRLDSLDNYIPGETEVYFIGNSNFMSKKLVRESPRFNTFHSNTGFSGTFPGTYYTSFVSYLNYYLGQTVNAVFPNRASPSELEFINSHKEEIEEMSLYPLKDSVKMIGNSVVVKLEETWG